MHDNGQCSAPVSRLVSIEFAHNGLVQVLELGLATVGDVTHQLADGNGSSTRLVINLRFGCDHHGWIQLTGNQVCVREQVLDVTALSLIASNEEEEDTIIVIVATAYATAAVVVALILAVARR